MEAITNEENEKDPNRGHKKPKLADPRKSKEKVDLKGRSKIKIAQNQLKLHKNEF